MTETVPMYSTPKILLCGDTGISVEFGGRVRFEEIDLWRAREIYLRNEYVIRTLLR